MEKGFFLTIEGCEGAGKSTQIRLLGAEFEARGKNFLFTREPGGCPVAENIRALLLSPENDMNAECEALLYAAARAEHLEKVILPALGAGKTVVCDRYLDSSVAYQGYARRLGAEHVLAVNRAALSRMPDATIFLDLPPDAAFSRKGGADKGDRLESTGAEFHRRVYEGFLAIAKKAPERVIRIDASGAKAETHAKIVRALEERGVL